MPGSRDLDIRKIIILSEGYTLGTDQYQVCINISLLLMFSGSDGMLWRRKKTVADQIAVLKRQQKLLEYFHLWDVVETSFALTLGQMLAKRTSRSLSEYGRIFRI